MASSQIRTYLAIARPDHWIKNIFVLPGAAVAILLTHQIVDRDLVYRILLSLLVTCIAASANYTINEYLDAEYDRHHPVKHNRPAALGLCDSRVVTAQYLCLSIASLAIGWAIGPALASAVAALLLMGLIYNVPPLRSKDRAYLDVLSESINNPLRFLIGWFAVDRLQFPPSSILLSYWMGGAFLMAVKRYAEYRRFGDPGTAAMYRRSFAHYTEASLHLSALFYAVTSSFFLGVFLIKYRIEFLITFPFFALLFTWYMAIGLRSESAAQAPEKLYREWRFMSFVVFLAALVVALFLIDLPIMHVLMDPVVFRP